MHSTKIPAAAMLMAAGVASGQVQVLDVDADTFLTNDERNGPTATWGNRGANDGGWEIRDHEVRVRIGYLRFDISSVDPATFDSATLGGHFTASAYNSATTWNVYGLNDDVTGDDVKMGNTWDEGTVSYQTASGVNDAPLNNHEFDFNEVTLLGTIEITGEDVQPLRWESNPGDLPLGSFLDADTDGLATFLLFDANATGNEYRIDSKEGTLPEGHSPAQLTFVIPEPSSLAVLSLGGLALIRRRR